MTPVLAVSSAVRTKCRSMRDCLDLTGSQRKHYVQQLQDMRKLNDHQSRQQEQLRNLLWEKDSLLAQQQEQLRNMEASLLKKSEEASSTQNQLHSAHDRLQKQKHAFSRSAQMVSSLKLQLASERPAQAMKAVQPPTASRITNSRLAVVRQSTTLLQWWCSGTAAPTIGLCTSSTISGGIVQAVCLSACVCERVSEISNPWQTDSIVSVCLSVCAARHKTGGVKPRVHC